MVAVALLSISFVKASTVLSAPWLAVGGILLALRECIRHFRHNA